MTGKNPLGNSKEPQSYEGLNIVVPPGGWQLVKSVRAPTTNDKKYPIGTIWIDTATSAAYMLTSNPGNWTMLASGVGSIDTLTGNTGGALTPSAGNLNVIGSGNLAFAGSGSTLTGSISGPFNGSTLTGLALGSGTGAVTGITYVPPTTYTPAITIGGSSTGITYAAQVGFYTQIGNIVFVNGGITLSSKGGLSGNVVLTGLPVASGTNGANNDIIISFFSNIALTTNYTGIIASCVASTTTAGLSIYGGIASEATTGLTGAMLANNSVLSIQGFYLTN